MTQFGAEDSLELTAPQEILDDLEIETVLAEDGTTSSYLFRSNDTVLVELRLTDDFAEDGITGCLSNSQFSLFAA